MKQRHQAVVKILRNEHGFTLVEILVVLTIFMVISGSLFYGAKGKIMNYTNEQMINQTEVLIRLAQTKSIETKSRYEIYALNCRQLFVRHTSNREDILFYQELPEEMELFISTNFGKIIFQPNGNISSAGSMSYHLNGNYHNFSLNIGKGRLITKNVGEIPGRTNTCGYTASTHHPIFSNVDTRSIDS